MWFDLSAGWIVALNVIAVPAIHFGLSWWFTRLPESCFDPGSAPYRERRWEQDGVIYQTLFRIRSWKTILPDAAPWFDGFAKGKLESKEPDYLRRFIVETCRGEACHAAQIAGLVLTVAWNPWPVAASVMIAYALLSNLPCLVLQRFTRARMRRLLAEVESGEWEKVEVGKEESRGE